jgi:hypothetical protein
LPAFFLFPITGSPPALLIAILAEKVARVAGLEREFGYRRAAVAALPVALELWALALLLLLRAAGGLTRLRMAFAALEAISRTRFER